MHKEKEIRAQYDSLTITAYQAYSKEIALPALKAKRFVSPFKMERMTWIKPSFLWMMYRSGWASKVGQEHVLAIKIKREGWEWALKNSCLSHFIKGFHSSPEDWKTKLQQSPVRIQWDPEKDISLNDLDYRSIQVGLSGIAVNKYVNEWIVSIEDISEKCREMLLLLKNNEVEQAIQKLPAEKVYEISDEIKQIIDASR